MQHFADDRITHWTSRQCITPCGQPPGQHDRCFTILRDEPGLVLVAVAEGGYFKLNVVNWDGQSMLAVNKLSRAERVLLGLADPDPEPAPSPAPGTASDGRRAVDTPHLRALPDPKRGRRLSPAEIGVAAALRRAGVRSTADLDRWIEQHREPGQRLTRRQALLKLAGRDAGRALDRHDH